ncbi:MAG: methyltransferase domain-containing protein [Pseudomonadota bacterium]
MSQSPPGSFRDTKELAQRYSETSRWQHERGMLLLEYAKPSPSEQVLDLGCGTGELSAALARRVGPSGQVTGIDPDGARLDRARKVATPELDNLIFEQASGSDMRQVCDGSIDLVYSNYAFHWMLDPATVFSEVQRVLRPGGRFVTEFLGEPIQLFVELILMMPGGKAMAKENIFLDEKGWRRIVMASQLEILDFEWPQLTLSYKDLQSLFEWLEATSHGAFDAKKLGPKDRAVLERKFPVAISCQCKGLRMMLRRSD